MRAIYKSKEKRNIVYVDGHICDPCAFCMHTSLWPRTPHTDRGARWASLIGTLNTTRYMCEWPEICHFDRGLECALAEPLDAFNSNSELCARQRKRKRKRSKDVSGLESTDIISKFWWGPFMSDLRILRVM